MNGSRYQYRDVNCALHDDRIAKIDVIVVVRVKISERGWFATHGQRSARTIQTIRQLGGINRVNDTVAIAVSVRGVITTISGQ